MSHPIIKTKPSINQEIVSVGLRASSSLSTISSALTSGTQTSSPEWNIIPLKACTARELQDVRHHIIKFHTKQDVDITKSFNNPVRMHRKDPQNIQFQLSRQEMDRRRHEKVAAKAAHEARLKTEVNENDAHDESENGNDVHGSVKFFAEMSRVAPDGGARQHRKHLFKRKTMQVRMMDETKRKLRYEEYYPWVMEDYTGDNVFVGSYEAGSTESIHVLFVFDKNCFKMVPAEKVYKFTPRNKYATLTLEEAEERMEKNLSAPRWLMKHIDEGGESSDIRFKRNGVEDGSSLSQLALMNRMRTVQGETHERDSDHDDLDFEEEFADDEEAPIMDGDEEENKLLEKKIKKEMLKTVHFDGKLDAEDDSDDDLNDLFEMGKSRKVDKEGQRLKKVLNKTEGAVYDSDSEEYNPYVSPSDLECNEESKPEMSVQAEPDCEVEQETKEPRSRTISISSVNDGFIVINAASGFLRSFPHGEWKPNTKKRSHNFEDSLTVKKVKLDDRASTLPTPEFPRISDLNNPGTSGDLVTTSEVLNIVRNNPLTTKELLLSLKNRIGTHRDNKVRIIQIVKRNLKLVDGKLHLKE